MAPILATYLAKHFLRWFAVVFTALMGIVAMFETVELMRRAAGKDGIGLVTVLEMSMLRLPQVAQELLVFAALFAAIAAFWKLTRSNELVVARAAGVSAWQFLLPAMAVAAIVGIFAVTVVSPVGAAMWSRFERLEQKMLRGGETLTSITGNGVWLKQPEGEGYVMINALRAGETDIVLQDVTVFRFGAGDVFVERIDARRATLQTGYWALEDAVLTRGMRTEPETTDLRLRTDFTPERLRESFGSPQTVSFWDLPKFISLLEDSGFPAHAHRMEFHRLLAQPVLLAAMVLIASTFSLRMQRRGGTLPMVVAGLAVGLMMFVLAHYVFKLGASDRIPVVLAAWTPTAVAAMIGSALVFHLEDG